MHEKESTSQKTLEVTYIGHSGFLVTLPEIYFLFDYFEGEIPKLDTSKELMIFSSHFHKDHYNKEILEFFESHPKSRFVVSKDIRIQKHLQKRYGEDVEMKGRVYQLKAGTETDIELGDNRILKIETLKSTDIGVAYLLTYDGMTIYHGGDLNMWTWSGESKAYNNDMEKKYMTQMEKLRGRDIDVAFVPLDPRLEECSDRGLEVFLDMTNTTYVFPMHCWEKYEVIEAFKKKPEHHRYETKIMSITERGEKYEISNGT